jgi:hypothetical protein
MGIVTLFIPSTVTAQGNDSSRTYPTTSSPAGLQYNEWAIKWWQWVISIPAPEHPNTNYTTEKCSRGQEKDSPVWFLAQPFPEEHSPVRSCDIPKDKAIITGLLSGECDTSDPRITDDGTMKQCASQGDDFGTIQVILDGVDLKYDLATNRILTDFFNITAPKNNIFQSPDGTFRGIVDGYFLFLKPLPPGQHELKYKVSVLNPTSSEFNYFQEVTYHLNVK